MATVLDASKALLVEVAGILNAARVEYVIVGGWSPYLRYTGSLVHPGTKDVDVLFSDASVKGGINEIVSEFISKGYLVSAKHDFQLLKPVAVEGRELVFNIDLLHPSETQKNPDMFVDHLDLHIEENDLGENKHVRSVVLPSSKILFEDAFHSCFEISSPITGTTVAIPLISEVGCILSKSESVSLAKRKRDAFDIYLSLVNVGQEQFARALRPYKQIEGVAAMLGSLRTYAQKTVDEDTSITEFDYRIARYTNNVQLSHSPSALVLEALNAV